MRFAFFIPAVMAASAGLSAAADYKLVKTVPVAGEASFDYLTVDVAARRVYVSHTNQVDVLDADSGEWVGKITETTGVHGIALAPELGKGFTSNGKSNSVTVFDLKTLKSIGTAKTGKNPDCIFYDSATKRIFAFNGGDKSATVIEANDGTVAGTIALAGRPEFAAADGEGHIFVNIEDKNTVVKIDAKTMTVKETWPLAPGATPCGLAIDPKSKRLFVGCRSKHLVVVDTQSGKVIANQPIGERVDATVFDSATGMIYCSCGDGTVSVFHADGDDKYSLVQTIKTKAGAKTMALDTKTRKIFLPSIETKASEGGGRPVFVPGSFAVLIFGI